MSLDNPKGGFGYAAEFQSSALPWVTSSVSPANGSPVYYPFQTVSRFVYIANLGATTDQVSLAFTKNGMKNGAKVTLNAGQSMMFEWRCAGVWIQGETGTPKFSLGAGLTTIAAGEMPLLSGTNADGSNGWAGVG